MIRGFEHQGGTLENRTWAYIHDILLIITTPPLLYINLMLLYVPIFDATRRKKIAQILNYFTAVISIRAEQSLNLPVVNMFKAQNVYAWAYARLVLQSFGQRILSRIDGYVGIWICVSFVMLVAMISLLFMSSTNLGNEAFIVQASTLILVVLVMICLHVFFASWVNDEYEEHQENVVLNEMKANSRWLELSEKLEDMITLGQDQSPEFLVLKSEKFRLEEAMTAMKRVVDSMTISNKRNPMRVLGMIADMTIFVTILTAIATLLSSVITILLRQQYLEANGS